MKSTGIVRRIDELGRIVIPKEIRKNLKIHEGDSLEIYIDRQSIILQKFSYLTNLVNAANQIVSVVSKVLQKNVLIVDLEKVIACSKNLESKYLNQPLSNYLVHLIQDRKNYIETSVQSVSFLDSEKENCSYVLSPILVDSDVLGAIILFDSKSLTEVEEIIAKMLSSFFVKNIEE